MSHKLLLEKNYKTKFVYIISVKEVLWMIPIWINIRVWHWWQYGTRIPGAIKMWFLYQSIFFRPVQCTHTIQYLEKFSNMCQRL